MTYSPAVHISNITFHAEIIFIYHFWSSLLLRGRKHMYVEACTPHIIIIITVTYALEWKRWSMLSAPPTIVHCCWDRDQQQNKMLNKNFTISKTDSWSPQDSICTCNNREIKYNRIYRMTILHVQRNKRIHHWENERSILSFKRRKICKIVS